MHVASWFINCGYDVPSPSRFDATNQSFSRPFPRDLHQLSLSLSPSARCNYYADKLQPESEFDCVRQLAGTRRSAKLGDRKFERRFKRDFRVDQRRSDYLYVNDRYEYRDN